jgi:hypothetical protein
VAWSFESAVAEVLSEGRTALADGVVMRPSGRDRDDVVERRRGAVSAGPLYVRADNAIRMDRWWWWCVYGRRGAVECGLGAKHARRGCGAAGCRRWGVVGGGGGEGGGMARSIFTLYRRVGGE